MHINLTKSLTDAIEVSILFNKSLNLLSFNLNAFD